MRLVFQSLFQHVLYVGDGPPLACLGKLQRDEGIEAHAAGAEEGQVVDDAIVEIYYLSLVDNVKSFPDVHGYAQMTGQPVARAAWNDAQRRLGMHQRASHLVHRSVAPYSHHDVVALGGTCLGQLGSMACILGDAHLAFKAFLVHHPVYQIGNFVLALSARNGINDERNMLDTSHSCCKNTKYSAFSCTF